MVPDPYWRFNRAHRLEAQQVRAQAAAAGMADAGMTPPPQPASGANIDCLPPTKLTDDQMVMEMDRRLNKHLRIVQRMEAISAVVLDD